MLILRTTNKISKFIHQIQIEFLLSSITGQSTGISKAKMIMKPVITFMKTGCPMGKGSVRELILEEVMLAMRSEVE